MLKLEEVLRRAKEDRSFTGKEILEFIEGNDKVVSGIEFCDDNDISYPDLEWMLYDICRDHVTTCDIRCRTDIDGDPIEEPSRDDIREAFEKIYNKNIVTDDVDIPFYVDDGEVTVLPFITYTWRGEKCCSRLSGFMSDAFYKSYETEFEYTYCYDYGHNNIEEWWEEGEGTFRIDSYGDISEKEQEEFFKDFKECVKNWQEKKSA